MSRNLLVLRYSVAKALSWAQLGRTASDEEWLDILPAPGGGVSEILRAGGWRSAAFAEYLDRDDLHATVIAELFTNASDSD